MDSKLLFTYEKEDIINNSLEKLSNINLKDVLPVIMPSNKFFDSSFKPKIIHEPIDFMKPSNINLDSKYIFYPVEFDYYNNNNFIRDKFNYPIINKK